MNKSQKLWVVNKMIEVIVKNECKKYELSSMEQQVLIFLSYHCNENLECWPSVTRLADICKCSKRYIQKVLVNLQSMGIIDIFSRKDQFEKQTSNLYRVHIERLSGEDSEIIHDLVDNFSTEANIKSLNRTRNKKSELKTKNVS